MSQSGGNSEGLAEGQVFAGYTIVRRLGAGGMGHVYLAQHPRLPRRDALKILPTNLTEDLEFRQRFNREADLAASLYHEHIVGIHDRGEYQGQLWISMDYVEGTDAAKLLRSQYPSGMPKADVAEIISAVADALDHAHSRGLLHRDVKPANILLSEASPRRRILLADFGIAREMGEISGLTATNMLVGTTAYCAPEQLQGNDLDARADQYALGCTTFNLLTGAAPFQHSNPAVVISQHLSASPPLVSERRPELAELDAVIAKAMAKDPKERYATCADFASALAGQGLTAPAAVAGPTEVIAGPTEVIAAPKNSAEGSAETRGNRRGPAMVIAALVAVALVAVAAVIGVRMLGARAHHKNSSAPSASVAPPSSGGGAPPSAPALKLTSQITDQSGVLGPVERAGVGRALARLYHERGTRLWVVYVNNFGGLKPFRWAEDTMLANGFADTDAILAVATDQPSFSFRVPNAVIQGKAIDLEIIRRDRIGPAVFHREWARAAIVAANGLDVAPS
ncbi:serine/threonine-protein kinase [Mycobacterium sp.]|uniref:serine/threonine-protein kinase n=1 Tax=Mycobacterium sp. TaxID=1785 RepID=UPI003F9E6AE8